MEKTGEVLDTLVAGAVVGAITGAAQSVAKEPAAVTAAEPKDLASSPDAGGGPGTKEVLNEMASGAVVGAVSGATKSVLPPENAERPTAKKSAPKKKSSKV